MCNSMTGYGRADFFIGDEGYSIDIKSLNHRFLDVTIKTPDRFLWIDGWIREEIKARFSRGAFSITLKPLPGTTAHFKINMAAVRRYLDCARDLKKLGIRGDVDIETLLKMKD
ncbi:MAG: hypothetical protein HY880_07080, partial [Deltaproteobacteria bacterium]|nr:hypothetical protein [Deltaproteobacteria bacterium]